HGGGGPGSGPIAVRDILAPFLPTPRIVREDETFKLDFNVPTAIGRVRSYYGNFLANVRAYAYMTLCGGDGIRRNSQNAVLNANYIQAMLKGDYHLLHDTVCMHESVFTDAKQDKESKVHAVDIAKRMLDYGIHPMTIYFPLPKVTANHGALMIEPTESESKETIDFFISVMKQIAKEAKESPELLLNAPHTTPVKRLDEVRATTNPVLCYVCGQ
ncbi:MAG: aminomethyl-transferring glycine dehydrogenase subunit GcvPB, partial [Planctomycetes bacterium]|nr:aminomethyl-transferring glycine dehydrogenase subunit GcvPB [Planctomycetota bacterium]